MAKDKSTVATATTKVESNVGFPTFQSRNVVNDAPGIIEGVRVRSVTQVAAKDREGNDLGYDKLIVNLDLTTERRYNDVISAMKEHRKAGVILLDSELKKWNNGNNMSGNILPRIGTESDFTGKFLPNAGEPVKVQLGFIKNGNDEDVIGVVGIFAMPTRAAVSKGKIEDILATIDAEIAEEAE